jgi:hypothetical protein
VVLMTRIAPYRLSLFVAAVVVLAGVPVARVASAAEPKVSFTRQIKPILAGKCFACHGPDEGEREADLRLDVREVAIGAAIEPGKSGTSALIERITTDDADLRMPPTGSKKPAVTPEELALLKRWIDEGAEYDAHWAYTRPTRPAVPTTADPAAERSAIDAFVLARLEAKGLKFASEADRRTLLRRLSFDVVGLPPTPAELAAFESDKSDAAYEKQVDRLLASEHFGERMAQYWLDVVRYADTGGYHSDNHRDVWLYRDYVISAFNQNMPFDQFTVEQLAGDLLPDASREARIASGYNRLLQTTEEGGAQPKEYTAKYAADRVRNTATIWLASTMGCCECHSHKFDPFSQKDFYRFAAFFADVNEKAVGRQDQTKMPTAEQTAQLAQLDAQLAAARTALAAQTPELTAARAKWETAASQALASGADAWQNVQPAAVEAKSGTKLTAQKDGTVLASGPNPATESYTLTLPLETAGVRGLKLAVLTDAKFPNKGLSRSNGNFVLTEVEVAVDDGQGQATPVKLSGVEADFSQDTYPIAQAIDGQASTGWAVGGHQKPADHAAVFKFEQPVGGPGQKLVVKLHHDSQFPGHNIGKFRLALSTSDKPSLGGEGLPENVAAALRARAEERSDEQQQTLDAHFRQIAPQLAPARAEIARLEAERTKFEAGLPTTLVSMASAPRTVRLLPRGNWLDDSGEVQQPQIPEMFVAATSSGSADAGKSVTEPARQTRLDLARWIASPENPLTARVFVNRLWKLTFGRGLARTLDDFGSQGEYPTHPELLDWLAVEFQDSGWNVKHVLKLMLLSQAYRQSSVPSAEALAKDPNNDLFSRQNRFRLDAEFVRDNALAVSGLLVPKIGGPSVKPYQPAGYWQYLNFPKREWENDKGENLYRRGLYTYWQRTFLHPSLAAFDATSREECTVERPRSNTPQQALVLLNDPTYVEAARALAAKVIEHGGKSHVERLEYAFREVLVRSPRPEEIAALTALVEKHQAEFAADKSSAEKLLKVGDVAAPAGVDPAELAAWTSVCRVLLNLHETITRN